MATAQQKKTGAAPSTAQTRSNLEIAELETRLKAAGDEIALKRGVIKRANEQIYNLTTKLRAAEDAGISPQKDAPGERTITVPIGEPPAGAYVSQHVDVQLTGSQGETLKAVIEGLLDRKARLVDGRIVKNGADAFKWMLEAISQ